MDTYDHLGARIKKIREEKTNFSQSDLARVLGVTPQAVQKWEAELTEPRLPKLKPIADALGVEVIELLRGTKFEIASADVSLALDRPDKDKPKRVREVLQKYVLIEQPELVKSIPSFENIASIRPGMLPLISWVQAGNWEEVIDNFAPGDAEDWIPCPRNHGPNAFYLRVSGESMYDPTGPKSYAPGDLIAVDPAREAINRSMVVVRLDHENRATFKQLLMDEDGSVMLKALNPNWHDRMFPMPEGSRIVGVVIGKWVAE